MEHENNLKDLIKAADFALWETVLYLDAYPEDRAALESYYKLRERAEELTALYESKYGPLTPFSNHGESWQWVKGPWPWESEAN